MINSSSESIAKFRKNYGKFQLDESHVKANPFEQFDLWFNESIQAGIDEPNAMFLATCGKNMQPSGRIVLLKDFSENGFDFHTNYNSRKGNEIKENPLVSATFFWGPLERQIRIEGKIVVLDRNYSELYFKTRPFDSRIGAWASEQSKVIPSREFLLKRFEEFSKKFKDDVPVPDHWGGLRIVPSKIEFWQGGENRLHDRILYSKNSNNKWEISRLSP